MTGVGKQMEESYWKCINNSISGRSSTWIMGQQYTIKWSSIIQNSTILVLLWICTCDHYSGLSRSLASPARASPWVYYTMLILVGKKVRINCNV